MRTIYAFAVLALGVTLAAAVSAASPADPEQLLVERLQFSTTEVAQARQGQPVVKVKVDGEELSAVGAIKLPGRKERLSDWVKNIEHFRRSAELGVAQLFVPPPSAASFTGLTLDPADLSALEKCTASDCAMRVPADVIARLHAPGADAAGIFRQMLAELAAAYLKNGNAAEIQPLVQKASTLTALSPELVAFLDRYPAATLPTADQVFYWSAMPAGSVQILSLHHLILYKPTSSEVWIADKNIYASRYFDTAVLVIGLYDAADGNGFYAVAGSRVKTAQLTGAKASALRRQIQRTAADNVKMYLEWIRDSLNAG